MSRLIARWHSVVGVLRGRAAFRVCDSVGRLCVANFGWPDIVNRGRINLGTRVWLDSHYAPVRLETGTDGVLVVGDRAGINYGAMITAADSVSIGADVSIAPYCVISDAPPGPAGAPAEPVVIEDGCWLATRVVVGPGAHIGRNAVISAGTHVSGTVEPNVVYGGSPPRVLRRLDSADHAAPAGTGVTAPAGAVYPRTIRSEDGVEIQAAGDRPASPRPRPERHTLLVADFTIDPLVGFPRPSKREHRHEVSRGSPPRTPRSTRRVPRSYRPPTAATLRSSGRGRKGLFRPGDAFSGVRACPERI